MSSRALLLCLLAVSSSCAAFCHSFDASTALRRPTSSPSSSSLSVPAIARGGGAAPLIKSSPPFLTTTSLDVKSPKDLYDGAVAAGTGKAKASFAKILQLGVVSGAHIGFGAYLAISVGGACPQIAATNPGLQKIILGAFGLPFGLIMTLITGGELFTGNTALVTAAQQEGKITTKELGKSWVASYVGNFVGSLLLAYLAYKSGTLGDSPAAVNMAVAKCSLPWDVAFVRGILCNWLVCMAVRHAQWGMVGLGN
jgi:formate transporter